MATPASSSLGKDLESLGKAFNACKEICEIGGELRKAKEQLESVDNNTDSINVTLPSLQEFKNTVKDCLRIAESLCGKVAGIYKNHSECLKELRNIANSGTLTTENVKNMTDALTKLLENFEGFGRELGEFVERVKELQRVSERVKDEATREEQKVRKEAASTRSEAQWNNVCQWTARITTFGLITLSSSFQDSVKANNELYERADDLDAIFRKFKEARQLLDVALQTINGVAGSIGSRPVQLTEEVIQVIRAVLLQYEKIAESQQQAAQAQQQTVEAEERAARAEQEAAESKKENAKMKEEMERMRREMEKMKKNQGK